VYGKVISFDGDIGGSGNSFDPDFHPAPEPRLAQGWTSQVSVMYSVVARLSNCRAMPIDQAAKAISPCFAADQLETKAPRAMKILSRAAKSWS